MPTETGRLLLREFTEEDALALFAMESRPEMVKYQDFDARTIESSVDYVSSAIKASEADPRDWVELAICQDEIFIGRVGAAVEGSYSSLWYAVTPEHQGNGYASEAIEALIHILGVGSYEIECDPRNIASCRLAERIGFLLVSDIQSAVTVKGEVCGSRTYRLTTKS